MGVLNNMKLNDNSFDIKEYIKYFKEKIQTGFKLDANNNYDCNKNDWQILQKELISATR